MKKYLIALALGAALSAATLTACSHPSKSTASEAEVPREGSFFDITNLFPTPQSKTEEELPEAGENEAPAPEVSETVPPMPEEVLPKTISYILVKVDSLNVRTGAGVAYGALGQVEKGVLLPLLGKSGNWYETVYREKTAFVSAEEKYTALFELEVGSDEVEAVISEGYKLLGTPYVYGAVRYHDGKGNLNKTFTTAKFDCSSLMQYIFYRGAHVLLDVNTRTQIIQGTHVGDDLRRGDLMFFTNASRKNLSGIERVGHVALYLGGNYILHTASDYAKIEQISATRWSYFIEARRVFS